MVTEYLIRIPCSKCGKIIEKKVKTYCSGACKVAAYRDKEVSSKEYDVDYEMKSPTVTQKLPIKPVTKKLQISAIAEKIPFKFCEHGSQIGLCKFGCKK